MKKALDLPQAQEGGGGGGGGGGGRAKTRLLSTEEEDSCPMKLPGGVGKKTPPPPLEEGMNDRPKGKKPVNRGDKMGERFPPIWCDPESHDWGDITTRIAQKGSEREGWVGAGRGKRASLKKSVSAQGHLKEGSTREEEERESGKGPAGNGEEGKCSETLKSRPMSSRLHRRSRARSSVASCLRPGGAT